MHARSTSNLAEAANNQAAFVPPPSHRNPLLNVPSGTSGQGTAHLRPRAHTVDDPSLQGGPPDPYRRHTPVAPGVATMHNPWSQPGARHTSGSAPYLPPPPPPSAPVNSQMQLPPPPPRMPNSTSQAHGPFVPPPMAPPGGYGMYNRQPTPQSYPPPREPRAYDPTAYAEYTQYGPLPPENQPLTSATYVPDGSSWGPGVGNPPLETHRTQLNRPAASPPSFNYDSYNEYNSWLSNSSYQPPPPSHPQLPQVQALQQTAGHPPPTPTSRHKTVILPPAKEREEYQSSPAQEQLRQPLIQPLSNLSDNREHAHDLPASPQEQQWSLERVTQWLQANSFSKEWQSAFCHLNVHGAQFLDIGRSGGQRNIGFIPQTVLKQVEREYIVNGIHSGYEQAKEREEGKRLRRLVRAVLSGGSTPASSTVPTRTNRRESNHFLGSAGTEGTMEGSPDLNRPQGSTPSTAGGTGDESPGHSMPQLPPRPNAINQPRAHTYDSSLNDSMRSNLDSIRGNLTKDALATIGDIPKRHSPSASSEISAPAARGVTSSPAQSPGLSNAKPASGAGYRYYSHSRGVSSETNIAKQAASLSPAPVRIGEPPKAEGDNALARLAADDRRRLGTDGIRPSIDNRNSQENPTSAKDHKRGFFDKFRRGTKRDEQGSPEDEHSPASPHAPRPVDTALANKANGISIEHINSAPALAARSTLKDADRKFVFTTPDGWNYRLIDITKVETAAQLRTEICLRLGLQESPDVTIYVTSPGQMTHDEALALNDQALMNAKKSTADAMGSLKLFIKTSNVAGSAPPSGGLGLQFTQSPPPYITSTDDSSISTKMSTNDLPESERKALLDARAEEHRRDTAQKQKDFLEARKTRLADGKGIHDFDEPRASSPRPALNGSEPERKTDVLVPMRKPPPVPEPTNTLRKADSLKKSATTASAIRTSWPNRKDEPWKRISSGSIPEEDGKRPAVSGIAGALVGAGMAARAFGTPSSAPGASSGLSKSMLPDVQSSATQRPSEDLANEMRAAMAERRGTSPRSPFTASKGGQMFKIPDYADNVDTETHDEEEDTLRASQQPALKLAIPPLPGAKGVKPTAAAGTLDLSPVTSQPRTGRLNRHSTKKGPSFVLPERQVDFQASPAMVAQESEDSEDSDDGLFAVPLRRQQQQMQQQQQKFSGARTPSLAKAHQVLGITSDTPPLPDKPALKLKTSQSNVRFASPQMLEKRISDDTESTDRGIPTSASSNFASTDSPDETALRRGSQTFSSDVWANRPPAEGIVENLDGFFPDVDLDQLVVEDNADTSPISTQPSTLGTKSSTQDLASSTRSITPLTSANESDASSFKNVAQRSMRKAGGLGRTKSIRDVVKNNYNMQPGQQHMPSMATHAAARGSGPSVVQPPNRVSMLRNDTSLVRRRSTRMFGANIEELKPQRGSRLINNLAPIPQDTLPRENVQHNSADYPKRQDTFRWMRGQLIGKGTFGRVYLGMNTTSGELLAVKQVEVNHSGPNNDPAKVREMVKALDIEIETMRDLDHVNIVAYLGCERKEYSISIFLEYISGGSVGSCLRKHGKFEESVVSSLTHQTLSGLSYLHSKGILHRDLKADNILLDLDGTCKISDFGISKRSANPYNNDITNSMQGSVFWMAPEVIRAQSQAPDSSDSADPTHAMNKGYSAKVDIWSLGCVVLEMFAGRRPWSKEEAIGAIYKLGSLNQAPPIPDDVSDVVGPAAISFMYDCFTIDPGERPTAMTLLRAPFCVSDPHYNFLDTELYAKIRGAF